MEARSASTLFIKVKGHATAADVSEGKVRPEDKIGNDTADQLACAGADGHAVPEEVVLKAKLQRHAAVEVHGMMLEILAEREARRQQMATEDGEGRQSSQSDSSKPSRSAT